MTGRRLRVSLVPALLLAVAVVSPVSAAARPGHFDFYGCTEPAPSHFTALKENLPAAAANATSAAVAYRLDDGSGVFVVQSFDGTTIAPGIPGSNLVVTCQIDFSFGTFTFSGFLAPR